MKSLSSKLALLLSFCLASLLHAAPSSRVDPAIVAPELDALLAQDWAKNNLTANPPARDEVFVRRLYLDLAGRIPTVRETEEFLGSQNPNKRTGLIDTLLASDG